MGQAKPISPHIQKVFDWLMSGSVISSEEAIRIIHPLTHGDYFRVCADFDDYIAAQQEMERVWKDQEEWTTRSILTVSGMGRFSSDNAYVMKLMFIMTSDADI